MEQGALVAAQSRFRRVEAYIETTQKREAKRGSESKMKAEAKDNFTGLWLMSVTATYRRHAYNTCTYSFSV